MRGKVQLYHLLLFHLLLTAVQGLGQVSLRVIPDRRSILIGEPIRLRVEIKAPLHQKLKFIVPRPEPHWVWINGDTPSVDLEVDQEVTVKQIVLTSYDSGYQMLPAIHALYGKRSATGDTVGIAVTYTSDDLQQDYRDIREIETVPAGDSSSAPLILAITGIVLLALLGAWYFRKAKGKPKHEPPIQRGLPKDFVAALNQIVEAYRNHEMDGRAFYIRADELLREYIYVHHGFDAVHATHQELVDWMTGSRFASEQKMILKAFLEEASGVKFARLDPGGSGIEALHANLVNLFSVTEK